MKQFTLDDLATMTERSILFNLIKVEMQKRGHWKNKARRIPRSDHFARIFVRTDTQNSQNVGYSTSSTYDETQFSDGL